MRRQLRRKLKLHLLPKDRPILITVDRRSFQQPKHLIGLANAVAEMVGHSNVLVNIINPEGRISVHACNK
jgi:hypothetical protein